jgi:hypothetical protein
MDYFSSFLQIKFPTMNLKTVLVKHEDVEKIVEIETNGKLEVHIYVKSNSGHWKLRFEGTMEEFKKNCETVRL